MRWSAYKPCRDARALVEAATRDTKHRAQVDGASPCERTRNQVEDAHASGGKRGKGGKGMRRKYRVLKLKQEWTTSVVGGGELQIGAPSISLQ
jgi:hypothetical protein